MTELNLAAHFNAFSDWRRELSKSIAELEQWLAQQSLLDANMRQTCLNLRARLQQDKLIIAFVAEFSRGKSELINALFFAGYKQRLLPSAAGRTTMCPTEILFEPDHEPAMYLLPVETRLEKTSIVDLKQRISEWCHVPLDVSSPVSMSEALQQLAEVKYVPLQLAQQYGFFATDEDAEPLTNANDEVEIPCWRHAIINFPHPILEQGLVILDTPGLNAIGAEPELTFSLLPGAHSVLYILAADAGVTKTDLAIWEQHLATDNTKSNHLVVLNKIDGLWDDIKPADVIQREIDRQVDSTARILDIPPTQIFPLSAQKGLFAKINHDQKMLHKSRLLELEHALCDRMLPARREIVANTTRADILALSHNVRELLASRIDNLHEQLEQLSQLRGKNESVIAKAFERSRVEKYRFEQNMTRYSAMRRVYAGQINTLLDAINMNALRANANRTHQALENASRATNVRAVIDQFFTTTNEDLSHAETHVHEIYEMVNGLSQHFSKEINIRPTTPRYLQFDRYLREIKRLQTAYEVRFEALWGRDRRVKLAPVQRFFEAIVTRAKYIYDIANRDTEDWLKNLLEPLDAQLRERQLQLRKHQESARRIALANNEVEEHTSGIRQQLEVLEAQQAALARLTEVIRECLDATEGIAA